MAAAYRLRIPIVPARKRTTSTSPARTTRAASSSRATTAGEARRPSKPSVKASSAQPERPAARGVKSSAGAKSATTREAAKKASTQKASAKKTTPAKATSKKTTPAKKATSAKTASTAQTPVPKPRRTVATPTSTPVRPASVLPVMMDAAEALASPAGRPAGAPVDRLDEQMASFGASVDPLVNEGAGIGQATDAQVGLTTSEQSNTQPDTLGAALEAGAVPNDAAERIELAPISTPVMPAPERATDETSVAVTVEQNADAPVPNMAGTASGDEDLAGQSARALSLTQEDITDAIRRRAYELYLRRAAGGSGDASTDWMQAERDVMAALTL